MEKHAAADWPIHDLLSRRWSPRALSPSALEADELHRLFEAARWSASCFNAQPWRFLSTQHADTDAFAKLLGTLAEVNQSWVKNASVLAVAVARLTFEHNGKPNGYAQHDIGAAIASMTFQATEMGIYVHPMAGFSADKVRELYGIPDEFQPMTAIAIGRYGDIDTLSDELREKELAPRVRKPLSEIVFGANWGETAEWV